MNPMKITSQLFLPSNTLNPSFLPLTMS